MAKAGKCGDEEKPERAEKPESAEKPKWTYDLVDYIQNQVPAEYPMSISFGRLGNTPRVLKIELHGGTFPPRITGPFANAVVRAMSDCGVMGLEVGMKYLGLQQETKQVAGYHTITLEGREIQKNFLPKFKKHFPARLDEFREEVGLPAKSHENQSDSPDDRLDGESTNISPGRPKGPKR